MQVHTHTQTQDPNTCSLQETHFSFKDTDRLRVKGHKKAFRASGNQESRISVVISEKVDFKPKTKNRQRRSLYNDEEVNSPGRYNNQKYIYTQHWST